MPVADDNTSAERLVYNLLHDEKQLVELLDKVETEKAELQKYFDEKNIKQLSVRITNKANTKTAEFVARRIERTYVKYDIEALKERLDKELLNEVIHKSYEIVDFTKLAKLLKAYDVPFTEVKDLLNVNAKVDTEAIKRLYDAGELTLKKLKGCYTANVVKSIKIKRLGG